MAGMNRILRRSIRCGAMVLWLGLSAIPAAAEEDAASIVRKLVALRKAPAVEPLNAAWPHLDSPDASVREAARLTVQSLPFEKWKDRALEEKSTWASLELLRALAESCLRNEAAALSPHLCEQITTLRLEQMEPAQLIAAMRVTRLVIERMGPVSEDELHQMRDLWGHLSAPGDAGAAREREVLIAFLGKARPRSP
jgi:hypothetical protein